MRITAADVEGIFDNGDFDTEAVFAGGPTVNGWFTDATDEVVMYGQVHIEAQKPSFTCSTADVADVAVKTAVTIDGTPYQVERKQKVGTGVSVLYLKTVNG